MPPRRWYDVPAKVLLLGFPGCNKSVHISTLCDFNLNTGDLSLSWRTGINDATRESVTRKSCIS